MFWQQRQFQDRAVNLWQAIATRYRDEPAVAGYNLLNEPADESRAVVGPFYRRLTSAIREIDPTHIHFLDGNTYATEFGFFGEPEPGTVYTLHDYVPAGLGRGRGYPGSVDGVFYDRDVVLEEIPRTLRVRPFDRNAAHGGRIRAHLHRACGRGRATLRLLADQLAIYDEYQSGWTLWTYKDVGKQGLVTVLPESPYLNRFGDFIAKKDRLGADKWGSDGEGVAAVTGPVQDLVATEFPASLPTRGAAPIGCGPCCSTSFSPSPSPTNTPT